MVVVTVGSLEGIEGNTRLVLPRESRPGLLEVGVRLNGERSAGGENLQEKGQTAVEAPGNFRAEGPLRVAGEVLGKRM